MKKEVIKEKPEFESIIVYDGDKVLSALERMAVALEKIASNTGKIGVK